MVLTSDTDDFEKQLLRFERDVESQLPRIAQRVGDDALAFARLSLVLGVYGTSPGAYKRTGDLLSRLVKLATSDQNGMSVTVSNDSPYARFIEYGVSPAGISDGEIERAYDAGKDEPVVFGRSGVSWQTPQPFVYSAALFAESKMIEMTEQAILNAWYRV